MTIITTPNITPADLGGLSGALRVVIKQLLKNLHDCIPAKVISYDRSKNRAMVQPLIDMVLTNGDILPREPFASVPVFRNSGGGVAQTFNLESGDCGWLKANDRDISIFKETGVQTIPNTNRKHSFEDAMFFPDSFSGISVPVGLEENATIQTNDGTSAIGYMGENFTCKHISTTKASMPFPLMTTVERDLIPDPQEGMFIWNTDTHGLNVYNGTVWG